MGGEVILLDIASDPVYYPSTEYTPINARVSLQENR